MYAGLCKDLSPIHNLHIGYKRVGVKEPARLWRELRMCSEAHGAPCLQWVKKKGSLASSQSNWEELQKNYLEFDPCCLEYVGSGCTWRNPPARAWPKLSRWQSTESSLRPNDTLIMTVPQQLDAEPQEGNCGGKILDPIYMDHLEEKWEPMEQVGSWMGWMRKVICEVRVSQEQNVPHGDQQEGSYPEPAQPGSNTHFANQIWCLSPFTSLLHHLQSLQEPEEAWWSKVEEKNLVGGEWEGDNHSPFPAA